MQSNSIKLSEGGGGGGLDAQLMENRICNIYMNYLELGESSIHTGSQSMLI